MEYQAAWRRLLVAALFLIAAGARGGQPPAQQTAEAPTSTVFDALEDAGVISGRLHVPMALVFNGRGELTLKTHGRPPGDISGLVARALSGGEPHQPTFTLDYLRSMFFVDTSSSVERGALVYVSMAEGLCPPCEGLLAEYDSALEAVRRDADVSVFVLMVHPDR